MVWARGVMNWSLNWNGDRAWVCRLLGEAVPLG